MWKSTQTRQSLTRPGPAALSALGPLLIPSWAADTEVGTTENTPSPWSSYSQVRLLQTQVQKLTADLKEQRQQAQLVRAQGAGWGWVWGRQGLRRPQPPVGPLEQEKAHLEEQLLQTRARMQQLEAELEALHGSCLLQLARSSWVGRMLRSSTGSVEVSLGPGSVLPARVPSPALLGLPKSLGQGGRSPEPQPADARQARASGAVRPQGTDALRTLVPFPPDTAHSPLAPSCRW